MAKKLTDLETRIDIALEDWIAISRKQDSLEWQAWRDWLRDQLHCQSEPDNFTVPAPYPPATLDAAHRYIEIRRMIRASIGWRDTRARISDDVYAWGAPGYRPAT